MRSLPPIAEEFQGCEFSDLRLLDRTVKVTAMFEANPALSIPQAAKSRGQAEAAYRLLANERVTPLTRT